MTAAGYPNITETSDEWSRKNQQYLVGCMEQIKKALKSYPTLVLQDSTIHAIPQPLYEKEIKAADSMPAIEYLCVKFSLSNFERSILLLCAAAELDSEVPKLCAQAQANADLPYPTFFLALSLFSDAHWSALTPTSALRRLRLVDVYGLPQNPIICCQLKIDERILHYLAGINYPDKHLQAIAMPISTERDTLVITATLKDAAKTLFDTWSSGISRQFNLVGSDEASKVDVANWVSRQLGFQLWQIHGEFLPSKLEEMEGFAELWARESAIWNAGLYISASEVVEPAMHVTKASSLGTADLDSDIRKLFNQFDLDVHSIRSVVTSDSLRSALATSDKRKIFSALWSSAVNEARPRMGELSQRVIPRATMDDIVLPERNRLLLKSIIVSVKQRYRVYDEWGFGNASNDRGLGTTAVFSGPSGTGKTMAAEVIANELGIDLFKIDLSMVVNKYIGETEKNLKRVFDAAESGGAVLLFDEADALFGKRSEVKDSHDRYANIEVGYRLQRMESYRGLAILTTNMKNSLDSAFMRRIRFMVNFAMPDEKSRQEIWKRVFPKSVPTKDLDFGLMSKLEIAGGHIRNIALGAAFL